MRPKPTKEITIEGFTINSKVKDCDIPDISYINYAYSLYKAGGYPAYIKEEVKSRYGNVNITTIASKHNSFKKDFKENPQWF